MHTTHDSPAESKGGSFPLRLYLRSPPPRKMTPTSYASKVSSIYPSAPAWSMHCERPRQATAFGSCSILKS